MALVLEQQADTLQETPTLVWRDLSTTAVLTVGGTASSDATAHGPKVIPPGATYETARYGDRPFPVVPVAYTDRDYQPHDKDLNTVINSPDFSGSTFNLYQEMSLGQLYPDGTVPSDGIAEKDFTYAPGFDFTKREVPGNTCVGTTFADSPVPRGGHPVLPGPDQGRRLPAARHHRLLRLGRQRLRDHRLAGGRRRAAADRRGLRLPRQARP